MFWHLSPHSAFAVTIVGFSFLQNHNWFFAQTEAKMLLSNQTYYLIGFCYFITNLLMTVDSNTFWGSLHYALNCILVYRWSQCQNFWSYKFLWKSSYHQITDVCHNVFVVVVVFSLQINLVKCVKYFLLTSIQTVFGTIHLIFRSIFYI